MKTLADLKRDAASGRMCLEFIERYGLTGDQIKSTMRGVRKVLGCNSVAISLLNNDGNISELRFGSAKLIEYDDETLTFYAAAHRELTEEEQANLDDRPGYAGVPNPLYTREDVVFMMGDAKESIRSLMNMNYDIKR